jgi:hypothetical protein
MGAFRACLVPGCSPWQSLLQSKLQLSSQHSRFVYSGQPISWLGVVCCLRGVVSDEREHVVLSVCAVPGMPLRDIDVSLLPSQYLATAKIVYRLGAPAMRCQGCVVHAIMMGTVDVRQLWRLHDQWETEADQHGSDVPCG